MPGEAENQINMTREEVMKLVSETIGKSVSDAVAPLRERSTITRDFIDAVREASAGSRISDGAMHKDDAWRAIRAVAASKARNWDEAVQYIRGTWKDESFAKRLEVMCEKALAAGDAAAGGVLLPTDLANEVIDLLRARTVVRRLGATTIDMPNGSIEIPKIIGGAAVGFVGENQPRNATQPEFGNITLTARKLIGIVPASNDLLRSPRANADSIIRQDLSRGMAIREDLSFIRDDGTSATPKGMKYWALPGNIVASSGNTVDNIISDLSGMLSRIQTDNVDIADLAWIMSPRSAEKLRTLRGTDVFLFRADVDGGRLMGLPLGVTSQIPINLGSGNKSEVYLFNKADAIIGETGQMEVMASSEAAYNDGSGVVVAAYSRDQTVIRVLERIDFAMRHGESVQVLTEVAW
jgi:HK97 family phage major capsid protein